MSNSFAYLGQGRFKGGPWDSVELPRAQATFDDLSERIESKSKIRTRIQANSKKALSWKYDELQFRESLDAGAIQVEPESLYRDFSDWLNDNNVVTLRNIITGEAVKVQAPKRGNLAYAHKYWNRLTVLQDSLDGIEFDSPIGRGNRLRKSHGLMITFTYDHKARSIQDAWHDVSSDVAKFKVQVARDLKVSIASITVKEGTDSGYPAPHMFIILERPVICFKHKKTWRVQNREVLDRMKSRWKRGFLDVQAVVGGSVSDKGRPKNVARYLFKYLSKAVKVEVDDFGLALKTFAWQKLNRLRPLHISRAFKDRTNGYRLDNDCCESQQGGASPWMFERVERCPLTDFLRVIMSEPPDWDRKRGLGAFERRKTVGISS